MTTSPFLFFGGALGSDTTGWFWLCRSCKLILLIVKLYHKKDWIKRRYWFKNKNLYTYQWFSLFFYSLKTRGHRLVVRTTGFHPVNRGSIPRGPAKNNEKCDPERSPRRAPRDRGEAEEKKRWKMIWRTKVRWIFFKLFQHFPIAKNSEFAGP